MEELAKFGDGYFFVLDQFQNRVVPIPLYVEGTLTTTIEDKHEINTTYGLWYYTIN